MVRKIVISSIFAFCLVLFCLAADITGRWDGTVNTPDGNFKVSYNFKMEGDKLTGTVNSDNGETLISEGKINGDEFSFKILYGDLIIPHQGKISGDSLIMKIQMPNKTVESTFRRAVKK